MSNVKVEKVLSLFKFPLLDGSSETAKLVWLIRLRWIAISLFFLMAGPALVSGVLERTTLIVYIGILSLLFLFNLMTHIVFVAPRKTVTPLFICFQLALDLVVLTSLLLVSGGFSNPFVGLFLLNASLGGVLIRGKYSWPFILLCHGLLISLQIIYIEDHLSTFNQTMSSWMLISHILIFSAWITMRSLGSYLENHFEHNSKIRLQNEKQDRLRALGALTAGFSHEFSSPLNSAKLRLDRLERHISLLDIPKSILENLHEAKQSISACESVIHQMNSSQMDTRDFISKSVDMKEFLSDVIESWKTDFPESQIQAHIENNLMVEIPPLNFAQVILNLLDNAAHAAPQKEIDIEFSAEPENFRFSVLDQGPGFSDLILSRQGEPFVTTKPNGTGLGLYVSEIFVQSLNGQMTLKNRSEGGAIVTLTWPRNILSEIKDMA
jgi:two-component system sensor histidine kinase RegB